MRDYCMFIYLFAGVFLGVSAFEVQAGISDLGDKAKDVQQHNSDL